MRYICVILKQYTRKNKQKMIWRVKFTTNRYSEVTRYIS